MSRHIAMRFSAIGGTAAGLGRADSGHSLIADRPDGAAGGRGLGFNGGQLLGAALGGCFWNDLHYAAEAEKVAVKVEAVETDLELAGTPPRVVRARITARLGGNDDPALQRVFDAACAASTIANSLVPAIQISFERKSGGAA